MVRGLVLAETTSGPLIMVVQFVAFLGAYHHPAPLTPWTAAVVGALLTTWVTFVPCFLFIFLGAPYVERLRGNHSLSVALTGITAAVVGVIANLALYSAVHTLFATSHSLHWGTGPAGGARPGYPAAGCPGDHGGGVGADLPAALVGAAHPAGLCRARPGRRVCRAARLLSGTSPALLSPTGVPICHQAAT
jgi:hypothetical protein